MLPTENCDIITQTHLLFNYKLIIIIIMYILVPTYFLMYISVHSF